MHRKKNGEMAFSVAIEKGNLAAVGLLIDDVIVMVEHIARRAGARDADGKLIPMELKADDTVLLPQYGGNEVTIDEEELVLFRDDDIMGVLKD